MTRPGRHEAPASGSAGFTLFELLVALSLLALLTIVLTGQVRFGLRAWETGAAVADDMAELQTVQNFLRRQLSLTQALREKLAEEDEDDDSRRNQQIFAGEPRQLRLAAAGDPRFGTAPYNLLELSWRRRAGEGLLHVDWRPHYPITKNSPEAEGRQRVLLTGVANVRFSYFGILDRRDRDAEARWHESWTGQARLPRLIRIELDFVDKSRYWPELTVALPLARK